jgi:flagellar hook-length control protein FliK
MGAAGQTFRVESTEAAASATRTGEQQAPPVTDQVTRHVLAARSLGDGTRETVLHLAPDHLGAVTVTLQVQGSDVRLDLAANAAALAALNADLGELRDGLNASGLELTDVTLRPDDGSGQQQPGRSPGQEGPGDGRQDGGPAGDGRSTDGRSRQPGGTGTAPGTDTGPRTERSTGTDEAGRRAPLDIRV